MFSVVLIIPANLRDKANTLGEALGYGPNNYSVALSANGQAPASHWGLHAWATQDFIDQLASDTVPDGVDYPQADYTAVKAALIVSVRSDYTGHFAEAVADNGLAVIQAPLSV